VSNVKFSKGDGVTWGYNGDYSPGTVERVTKSRVFVRSDRVALHAVEGVAPAVFEADPNGTLEVFTYKPSTGRYSLLRAAGWTLSHGRDYRRNPSF
jgi:hypothetical protein